MLFLVRGTVKIESCFLVKAWIILLTKRVEAASRAGWSGTAFFLLLLFSASTSTSTSEAALSMSVRRWAASGNKQSSSCPPARHWSPRLLHLAGLFVGWVFASRPMSKLGLRGGMVLEQSRHFSFRAASRAALLSKITLKIDGGRAARGFRHVLPFLAPTRDKDSRRGC
ncbi:unnamed protein product [Amoebophrya sp. A120]|nr:unnamed protein product [Amoebophrya sp. A120]|eukprot:GSA120T00015378001.1